MSAEHDEAVEFEQEAHDPTFKREYYSVKFAREQNFIEDQWSYMQGIGIAPKLGIEEALVSDRQVIYDRVSMKLSSFAEMQLGRAREAARFAERMNRKSITSYEKWLQMHQAEIDTDFGAIVKTDMGAAVVERLVQVPRMDEVAEAA